PAGAPLSISNFLIKSSWRLAFSRLDFRRRASRGWNLRRSTLEMRPSRQHSLGGIDMIRKVLFAALTIGAAHATETIVWWDFLSGGDGVRMKSMLDEFNKEHEGKVKIDATTLEWGVPFYTKVQTSAATGQGPDVMTYHESRMPLGISTGALSPITPEELAASGIKASDFGPANWK